MPLCGGTKTVQRKLVLLYVRMRPRSPQRGQQDDSGQADQSDCRGDGACGKTSLLNVFTRGYFPTV